MRSAADWPTAAGPSRRIPVGVDEGQTRDRVGVWVAVGEGFRQIARAEQGHVRGLRGAAGRLHPCVGSATQHHGDRHVGRLAGGRGLAVVEIEMAVEVRQPDPAERPASAREGAGQQRAATAHHEDRRAPGGEVGDGVGDATGCVQHVVDGDHAGGGIADVAADPHVEIAGIGRPRVVRARQRAERRGGVLRAARATHRVDGNAEQRERRHRRISRGADGPSPCDSAR